MARATLLALVIKILGVTSEEYPCGKSEYWMMGQSDHELDLACGWPTPPAACSVSPKQIELRPGAVAVIDDFLSDADYTLLRGIVAEGIVSADSHYVTKEEHALNTSFSSVVRLPDQDKEPRMLALLRRIQGNAVRTIRSLSDFMEGPWAYKGAFFPDYWVIRRYHKSLNPYNWQTVGNRLNVHSDAGMYARCLSAVLFFGSEVQGGSFRTHRCKSGDCTAYGWQYDQHLPAINQSLLVESNLEVLAEVPYKAGRLVFFLAETLHDVTETLSGDRDVLFMWFGCEPSLRIGIADNGHLPLVEFLVSQKADVTKVSPSSGEGPIHYAAVNGHAELVIFLVTQDPQAVHRKQGVREELALHQAAALGHTDVVKILISHRADVLSKDAEGLTALDYAWKFAPYGNDAAVAEILQNAPALEL